MDNAEKVRSKIRKAAYRPLTLDERSWSLAALDALVQQAADAQARELRLAQGLRVIRDTTTVTGYAANVASRALIEADVPDPPDEDHP